MAANTANWNFGRTAIRAKNPKESVKFYEFLGMKQLHHEDYPDLKSSSTTMGYDGAHSVSANAAITDRQGLVELIHLHGSENDANFKIANGNSEPGKGFGHLCVSVDNIQASCKRLEDAGYKFQKKLTDGRMRSIAFVLDPDGYWVEVIGQKPLEEAEKETTTNTDTYKMNHTMIRIKDAEASLKFYKETLGMSHVDTMENPSAEFNLYFLGYPKGNPASRAHREGLLELTWNYGTEKDPNFKYHNGNTDPLGFAHLRLSVDNHQRVLSSLEAKGVRVQKRSVGGNARDVTYVQDPDGYEIELVQNEAHLPS